MPRLTYLTVAALIPFLMGYGTLKVLAQASIAGQADTPATNIAHVASTMKDLGDRGGLSVSPSHSYINSLKDLQARIDKAKADALAAQEAARQAQIEREAIIASQTAPTSAQVQPVYNAPTYTSSCSDAKSCIYDKESGNSPMARNSGGCYGLGQDCNGVVETLCGPSYECQDAFFTAYALGYGGWEPAWTFWQCIGTCYSPRTQTTIIKKATWW